jgi:hypothetical protein
MLTGIVMLGGHTSLHRGGYFGSNWKEIFLIIIQGRMDGVLFVI